MPDTTLGSPVAVPWRDLLAEVGQRGNGGSLGRMLELWCTTRGVAAAALYGGEDGERPLLASWGESDFPRELGDDDRGLSRLDLGLNASLLHTEARGDEVSEIAGVDLLLAEAGEVHRLRDQVRRQNFQEGYRLVELEAVYEVGLAIASTLNLDELSEGVLLRAVSLSDARRGALYLREGDDYRLQGTIGGDARESISASDPQLASLAGDANEAVDLLPGADYTLALPIEIDGVSRGLLAIGDKESRAGVGPFEDADRRTLGLFANQAAIALENAYLHRQALEKERLEREMELAAEIQGRLLPKGTPEIAGYELAGWNRPAWQVGGDYYDYLELADGRYGLVVADVTGKGLAAALLVSTLHSALQLLFDGELVDEQLIARLNEHIVHSSSPNKFITMILACLDPSDGSLRSLNAGHNPGLIVSTDGEITQLGPSGMPLGLLAGSAYKGCSLAIDPGDLLCLYSDGITECAALDDEEYGQERLEELLRAHSNEPLPNVIAVIDEEMRRFSEGRSQSDDQTVLLMRRGA